MLRIILLVLEIVTAAWWLCWPSLLPLDSQAYDDAMSISRHKEFIDVLTELYTLLDDRAAFSTRMLRLPPTGTGLHPPHVFNASAALKEDTARKRSWLCQRYRT